MLCCPVFLLSPAGSGSIPVVPSAVAMGARGITSGAGTQLVEGRLLPSATLCGVP